ncbi:hypothetical protein Enr10x_25610 [Gimesia panareensis]|uniref:Uncharacterized protein n=1 Tax=Gimesia panareensis TaxID=2527978 RepID=A0A517Q6M4_9PLAN|nr:hypothetical protein [Gimesia panareensis]QDT27246.1 hypothetical protein Enr10x_25610 [Gimesia panareensis]
MNKTALLKIRLLLLCSCLICLGQLSAVRNLAAQLNTAPPVILNRDQPRLVTERSFRRALTQPISASWSNVEIRMILEKIEDTQQISLLLDRRIDPSTKLNIDLQNQTLEAGLQEIAAQLHARTTIVGSNVYMGPDQAVGTLKTLLALKHQELLSLSDSHPGLKSRMQQLSRNRSFYYQDLDTPAEILKQIAEAYQITISNPERIPHDLWFHGALMAVNANEALTLVLNQLDLTFLWEKQGRAIRIMSIPDRVTIQKTYAPRGSSLVDTVRRLKEAFPEAMITAAGRMILVDASSDIQEKIEADLNPSRGPSRNMPSKPSEFPPIRRRKFTLRVQKVPVLAVMQKLEQSGIEFKYQEDQLKQAGVDLTRRIDISVENANANEFFDALFGPLKLSYQIEGLTVTLTP